MNEADLKETEDYKDFTWKEDNWCHKETKTTKRIRAVLKASREKTAAERSEK